MDRDSGAVARNPQCKIGVWARVEGEAVKLLSIKQVAEVLGISRWTVAEMLQHGALPGIVLKSGKRKKMWKVSEQALEKWVATREAETKKSIQDNGRKLRVV